MAADVDPITAAQLRLRAPTAANDHRGYRVRARWWELEARRGYPSSGESLRYARNLRWAAELAGLHGPGAWLDLIRRAGAENPEVRRGQ